MYGINYVVIKEFFIRICPFDCVAYMQQYLCDNDTLHIFGETHSLMEPDQASILIVDDDPGILHSARMFLKQLFTEVSVTGDPGVMMELVRENSVDVVLLDMNFTRGEIEGKEGIGLLQQILRLDPDLPVIFITAYGDFDLAVRAIKTGAHDFLVKPWKNQRLHASILTALKYRKSRKGMNRYRETASLLEGDGGADYADFIGESLAMKRVKEMISRVGPTDADVLITGENGTGKEMAARQLHQYSDRANMGFMKVDIASLNENLFESELFGHEKGAFTDAMEQKAGRFELASGGTLFMDEIGDLNPKLQSKILSVLQNREIFRVGNSKPIPVDIRLICATNRNLALLVKEGSFREDLFYRINMFEIEIPPLRERPDDIPPLVSFYLEKFKLKYHKPELKLYSKVMEKLKKYQWPGNIRELKNAMERAVILENSRTLTAESIFPPSRNLSHVSSSKSYDLVENEKKLILEVIQKNRGNMTNTARDLGLERTALYRRLKKYGL
jgi:DNA-binding NtrC family response regulator